MRSICLGQWWIPASGLWHWH